MKKTNKLSNYIDRVRFNVSKEKYISKKSLLYLIPEVYNEKFYSDNRLETEKRNKLQLDQFFYDLMNHKFKLRKLVKKHCEETIMSIYQYSGMKFAQDS